MVFDRNAITTGRRMQDFGLCDLQGVYQNTVKLRAKGYLAVAFLNPADSGSAGIAKLLQEWTAISDKLSLAAVVIGERGQAEQFAANAGIAYPVLWDFEMYTLTQWAVTATPTLFVMDSEGVVLRRITGSSAQAIVAAKTVLEETIRKANEAAKAKAEAEARAKEAAEAAAKSAAPDPKQGGAPSPVSAAPAGAASTK